MLALAYGQAGTVGVAPTPADLDELITSFASSASDQAFVEERVPLDPSLVVLTPFGGDLLRIIPARSRVQ